MSIQSPLPGSPRAKSPKRNTHAKDVYKRQAPRDASAAAVVASALLELSTYLPGEKGREYKGAAIKMLKSLSSDKYQSRKSKPSFLLHSTGHWPAKSEIDASIIYADYYYMEALLRLKKLDEKENG